MKNRGRDPKIRLISALVILASMLVVAPQTTFAAGSPHDITFLGRTTIPSFDPPGPLGETWYKWSYSLTSNGDVNAISHVEWGLCVPCESIVAVDPDGDGSPNPAGDETWECSDSKPQNSNVGSGYTSYLKMQVGWGGGETRTVFFVTNQFYWVGPVEYEIKYGTSSQVSLTEGPVCEQANYVELGPVSLSPGKGGVQIDWMTGTEVNNVGFNIYRSRTNNFANAQRVNGAMIPSKAFGSIVGASYQFVDRTAFPGRYYIYWLEDISASGQMSANGGIHELGVGTWAMPKNLRVMPLDGAREQTMSHDFYATYKDADGDLAFVYLLVGKAPDLNAGMVMRYDVQNGLLSVYDKRIPGWKPGVAPRTKANAASRYGALRGWGSWVKILNDGDVVRIRFRAKFWKTSLGLQNVYMMAEDIAGNTTGWDYQGTWNIIP